MVRESNIQRDINVIWSAMRFGMITGNALIAMHFNDVRYGYYKLKDLVESGYLTVKKYKGISYGKTKPMGGNTNLYMPTKKAALLLSNNNDSRKTSVKHNQEWIPYFQSQLLKELMEIKAISDPEDYISAKQLKYDVGSHNKDWLRTPKVRGGYERWMPFHSVLHTRNCNMFLYLTRESFCVNDNEEEARITLKSIGRMTNFTKYIKDSIEIPAIYVVLTPEEYFNRNIDFLSNKSSKESTYVLTYEEAAKQLLVLSKDPAYYLRLMANELGGEIEQEKAFKMFKYKLIIKDRAYPVAELITGQLWQHNMVINYKGGTTLYVVCYADQYYDLQKQCSEEVKLMPVERGALHEKIKQDWGAPTI